MKIEVLLDLLFELLNRRKATAQYFSQKYSISQRTVYRYVDVLSVTVPIEICRGRGGGIYISDAYKLPVGFLTREEYSAADEALEAMYSQLPEERFLTVRKKLAAQSKEEEKQLFFSGDANYVLIDSGSWGDSPPLSEKIRLFENAAKSLSVVEIDYFSREGERTVRKIDPHILIYKQNVWYVYAYCRLKKDFRLFRIGRVYSAFLTGESFVRREVKRENIPLHYWNTPESAEVMLEVDETAYADVQDWLGCESLRPVKEGENDDNATAIERVEQYNENAEENGKEKTSHRFIAHAALPFDDALVKKIVGLGAGVKVLAPETLKEKTAALAAAVAEVYKT